MRSYETETDPRILKELIKLIVADNAKKDKLIESLMIEKSKAEQQKFSIEESYSILRKKFFGRSSEKMIDRPRSRSEEDSEILLHSQNIVPPPSKKSIKSLDEEEITHECSEAELIEASKELGLASPCPEQWEKLEGVFDQNTEIEIVERSYKKVIHKRQKYKLKSEFNTSEKEAVMISSPGGLKLIPGASYSIDFAVAVVIDKYLNHLPLERQCRMMDSLGLSKMSPQVLYNLSKIVAIHLELVVDRIKESILSKNLVHSDETPWPINNNKDSDGYMWILSNQLGSYYRFEPTRSGAVIAESLEDYCGKIMSDGYSGYTQFRENQKKNVNNNILALCHAHARRYFFEIKEDYPIVEEYLHLYGKLFDIEHRARDFTELRQLRDKDSRKIIEEMRAWLIKIYPDSRAESKLRQAIEYSSKNWKELTLFLEDPEIPLTNNEAERTIRQAVMGRKNFYGSRSIDGADVAAIIYSVIESCKKVEIDPRNYLQQTIRDCAGGKSPITPLEFAQTFRQ
jgi:transposase